MWCRYDRNNTTDLSKIQAEIPPATPTPAAESCIYFFSTVQISEN